MQAVRNVDPARVQLLNDKATHQCASYVLLWVQQDVRAVCNHALEFAILEANKLDLPLLACYGLYERFPDATERAFKFLLEGLRDASQGFASRGVRLVCKRSPPPDVVVELARHAACLVVDRGYAKICRLWRGVLVERLPDLRIVQVETNVVVPVGLASNTRESSAATLRPKIRRHLPRFFTFCGEVTLQHAAPNLELPSDVQGGVVDLQEPSTLLSALDVDRSVPPVSCFQGGTTAAVARLQAFLPKLGTYGNGKSNDPSRQENSFLSPYLHFGHISPLDVCLRVRDHARQRDGCVDPSPGFTSSGASGVDAFIEELVVRRELARNFCSHCDHYNSFECLPDWAQRSLLDHVGDQRSHAYEFKQLERGETDDPCWNAAQWEMVASGHMHNYMRMYWCKQLILWTSDPRIAFQWACRLNDRYSLDGRDENGYMGIAWCFGHHDRPFPERPIFGIVRPMTRKGLESKFDMGRYKTLVYRKCREAAASEPRYLGILPPAAFGSNGSSLLRFVARPSTAAAEQKSQSQEVAESAQQSEQHKEVSAVAGSSVAAASECEKIPPQLAADVGRAAESRSLSKTTAPRAKRAKTSGPIATGSKAPRSAGLHQYFVSKSAAGTCSSSPATHESRSALSEVSRQPAATEIVDLESTG